MSMGIREFCGYLVEKKSDNGKIRRTIVTILLGGDLILSIVLGIAAYFYIESDADVIGRIRRHFGDMLTIASILFGFCLASLIFYIQDTSGWKQDPSVKMLANKIVELQVWSVLWWQILIAYTLTLWIFGEKPWIGPPSPPLRYSFLVFAFSYCLLQVSAHSLMISHLFRYRKYLRPPTEESDPKPDKPQH